MNSGAHKFIGLGVWLTALRKHVVGAEDDVNVASQANRQVKSDKDGPFGMRICPAATQVIVSTVAETMAWSQQSWQPLLNFFSPNLSSSQAKHVAPQWTMNVEGESKATVSARSAARVQGLQQSLWVRTCRAKSLGHLPISSMLGK